MQQDESFAERVRGWVAGTVPEGWFTASPSVETDGDEVQIVGALKEPALDEEAHAEARAAARAARIAEFRAETREHRMRIAAEMERRFGRKVSWGATCGDERQLFTNLSLPVMTRLRLPERTVLDTLIDAGVARSRSEALTWCVRLVAKHERDWLQELRDAFAAVERVRAKGPVH